jgi:hypothetical protein
MFRTAEGRLGIDIPALVAELLDQPNDYFPELRATAILSMGATAGVFEGSGRSIEEISSR